MNFEYDEVGSPCTEKKLFANSIKKTPLSLGTHQHHNASITAIYKLVARLNKKTLFPNSMENGLYHRKCVTIS